MPLVGLVVVVVGGSYLLVGVSGDSKLTKMRLQLIRQKTRKCISLIHATLAYSVVHLYSMEIGTSIGSNWYPHKPYPSHHLLLLDAGFRDYYKLYIRRHGAQTNLLGILRLIL